MELDYEFKWDISFNEMQKRIEDEITKILKERFGVDVILMGTNLREGIRVILRKHIEHNEIFQSVLRGELLGELGLPMDRRMWASTTMVDMISDGIEVKLNVESGTGTWTINIDIIWSNEKMDELINHGEASYISSSGKPGLGGGIAKYQIPWLDWLLTGGSETLISGFHIEYGEFPTSRSKMALMKEGGTWKMPFGHFTKPDNFITQSIERARTEIIEFAFKTIDPSYRAK